MAELVIIIPAYNEAEHLGQSLARITAAVRQTQVRDFQILVIDDGSKDGTAAEVLAYASQEPAVGLLSFTRNFGKEAAIVAGLDHADGDAVIIMDADLQHPPEIIADMIALWRQGFPVVEAVKQQRETATPINSCGAWLFYRLFSKLTHIDIEGHSDFKLLDRAVVEQVRSLKERKRFFRGLVAWMGFKSAVIPFVVPTRSAGNSRWGRQQLIRYAINNITGFSSFPLTLIGLLGLLVLSVGFIAGIIALYQKFAGIALDGFTTVIILIALSSGALMLSLGLIGLYLAHMYEEIKNRPLYIVRSQSLEQVGGAPEPGYPHG